MNYRQQLQQYFKESGSTYSLEYFNQEWFTIHQDKYHLMLHHELDLFFIDEWIQLEKITNKQFKYYNAQKIIELLSNHDIHTMDVEDLNYIDNYCKKIEVQFYEMVNQLKEC